MKPIKYLFFSVSAVCILLCFLACNSEAKKQEMQYTCPMPEDSVFSSEPGRCPKCGMELIKLEAESEKGRDSTQSAVGGLQENEVSLESLIRPANEFVVSSIPMVSLEKRQEQIEIEALGNIGYDTRQVGSISSRFAGRIEKLYVRYRYQKISKGQRIMDVYSPELVTAQQDLLFLLKNDAGNINMIEAAKSKLLLLGMSSAQLQEVMRTSRPAMSIAVYSNYAGHIHESVSGSAMEPGPGQMRDISLLTEELSLKEGMYLLKGQSVFTVFNPARAWAVLNIYGDNQGSVKAGNVVRVVPETAPEKDFRAKIDFIEPFYRKESKTLTARVYFDNSRLNIPIGSQVRATIFGDTKDAQWLPKEAVLSLGLDRVAFVRTKDGFRAQKITTGIMHEKHIQVTGGLNVTDSVAANAQYLIDSESFIKVK